MTRSSASTTGARTSTGSIDRPSPGGAGPAGGKAKKAVFSPWIMGFSGTSPPARLLGALREGRICGLILFRDNLGGSVEAALELCRVVRGAAPPGRPFVFLIDEEGGLISQTSGLDLPGGGVWPALPTPRALGRHGRPVETRWVGQVLGRRLRQLGFRADLAPCLDLDTEPENPVIGSRSFGAAPEQAAEQGWAFAQGLMDVGVIPCFKHYPGHGGTRADSHRTLPVMDSKHRAAHELPFRLCLERAREELTSGMGGAGGAPAGTGRTEPPVPSPWIMPAHVDWGSGLPASLDPRALRRLARWNGAGLRITDALDMGAVALEKDAARQAMLAGNDLLLVGRDWARGLDALNRWEREVAEDAPLRAAVSRARRRVGPVWAWTLASEEWAPDAGRGETGVGKAGRGGGSLGAGERDRQGGSRGTGGWRLNADDADRLALLHRLCVRLNVPPETLPKGGWIWVVPEGFHPYTRLRHWKPPRGRRRFCSEILWIPEKATQRWVAETARRLRAEERPILLATLFRGRPAEAMREAWGAFLGLPRLSLVAHLLDEVWPEARPGENGGGVAAAFTSGPSVEGLSALAEALDLPENGWIRGPDGLHYHVDSGA